jgi:hypothetical protein
MRNLAILALSALASTALAQSPLNTLTGGTNGGNVGGGIYFDLTVNTTITLTQLSFRTGGVTAAGSNAFVDIYLGPSTYVGNVTNAGLWTLVGSTVPATVVAGQQVVTAAITPVPQITALTLGPGTYGIALKSNNHSHGYTNGLTCTSTTIPGSCANSLFSNAELTLRAGAAQNLFLSGGVFAPRIFNGSLFYTNGGTPITFAQRQPYGAGCYAKYRSFYEFMPSTATGQDLSNTSFRMIFDGGNNRYSAVVAGTTAVVPSTSPNLLLTDDSNVTVPLLGGQPILFADIPGVGIQTTSVEMCSNGYINLNGTNVATQSNPTVVSFLTGTPRVGNWHDMDPGVGGTTHYDYDAVNLAHLFTWSAVPDWNIAGSSNTFQLAFFANGDIEFRFGAMSLAGGGGWPTLVGYSPGGTSLDPNSIDISASFPFATEGIDQNPLTLIGDANPVIGTTVNLTTSNETGLNVGLCFVSVADLIFSPGGLDLGVIGAAGCVANVDINQGVGNVISNLGIPGLSMTVGFPIPNAVSILGQSFYSQSAWLDATQNAGGITTSNALRLKVGSF